MIDTGPVARDIRPSRTVPAVLVFAAFAWLVLFAVDRSPWSAAFEHGALENLGDHPWRIMTLASGWMLMVAAMMLPTSLQMFGLFARLTAARRQRRMLMAILVGTYVLIWSIVGVAMHMADLGVHRLVDEWPWLRAHPWAITSGTLALAGAYQLTGLKERCAARCRSPQGFVRSHWHGESAMAETRRLALDHAVSCVGCCWALMLVMFAVGVGSMVWMAGLTALMVAEKTKELGQSLKTPVAVWLMIGAIATAIAG